MWSCCSDPPGYRGPEAWGRCWGGGYEGQAGGTTHCPLPRGRCPRVPHGGGWVGQVEAFSLTWDATREDVARLADALAARPGRTGVLVLGDGSARRGEKAPGYLDQRAFPFDDALAEALADGDASMLAALDVGLAAELMVLGAAAFRLLGAVGLRESGPAQARLTYRDDPFGVSYFVATWHFAGDVG